MNRTETQKTAESISSDVRLYAPASWDALTQEQLRYVFELMVLFDDIDTIKSYMFVRLTGITVLGRSKTGFKLAYTPKGHKEKRVFYMDKNQILDVLWNFNFIDTYEGMGTRLDCAQGLHAVDILLHGVAFIDYLNAEKLYQGYVASRQQQPLEKLFHILYRNDRQERDLSVTPTPAELFGTFMWYSYVKSELNKAFPHFFKPASDDAAENDYDIIGSMNAQIRALTDGDVTKEKQIMEMDCWRALTELDAKARDAQEMKKMLDKNKRK